MIGKILGWIVLFFLHTIELVLVAACVAFVIFAFTGYI